MTDTSIAPWKANEEGDNTVARPPVKMVDNGDSTFSLSVSDPGNDDAAAQRVLIINQNTTIIQNQQTIISLLQGGIGVNILSGNVGGL